MRVWFPVGYELVSRNSGATLISSQVQLVLEYMDGGSLRDALDAGCFMTPAGARVCRHVGACVCACALDAGCF